MSSPITFFTSSGSNAPARSVIVTDLGAVGDGTTDDTAALQAAFASANASKLPVYIPATSAFYKITSQLTGYSNLRIVGDGYYSQIRQTNTGTSLKNVMKLSSVSGVRISGVHFRASGGFSTAIPTYDGSFCGLVVTDCTDVFVEDCVFTNSAYVGLFGYRSNRCFFRRNSFPDAGTSNPYLWQSQATDIQLADCSNCEISENICYSTGTYPGDTGIAVFGGTDGVSSLTSDIIIRANVVRRKTQYGVTCYAHQSNTVYRMFVTGNTIQEIDGSYHHIADGTLYSGITAGSAAGTGIYMQHALESFVTNNKIYDCGVYGRNNGTLLKSAISGSGAPDIVISGNHIRNAYFNGIFLNNSGLAGDYTNRAPRIGENFLLDFASFVAVGSMTSGQTTLTLADAKPPLSSYEVYRAGGGFYVGDAITVEGAGSAGAALEATITAISGAVLTLNTTALTTIASKGVILSELSGTPPSTRGGIIVGICDRVLISGNTVVKSAASESFTGRTLGIQVAGTSGATPLLTPRVTGNILRGLYNGIQFTNVSSGSISDNTVSQCIINGILADNNDNAIQVGLNTVYNCSVGIRLVSLGGSANNNNLRSCGTGIHYSNGATARNNRFLACTTPFDADSPMGTVTLVAGTSGAIANTSVTANTQVRVTRKTAGGTLGNLTYTVSAGASFTINSTSATDTSVVDWELVEPA